MQHSPLTSFSHSTRQRVGVLLLPGFSMLSHANAVEPLFMANQLSGQVLYQVSTVSLDEQPVRSSTQLACTTDYCLANVPADLDMLLVCAPSPLPYPLPGRLAEWLRQQPGRRLLGGLAGGAEVLVRAGLLEGYRATLPWERFSTFVQAYPQVALSRQLFEIDRNRLTCASGAAAMDMMLTLMREHHGHSLVEQVSEHFMCERVRSSDERQHVPLRHRLGHVPESLVDAVTLMEANIEEPLSTLELAEHLGVSRRQLERLFKKHLQAVPSRYYLNIRLQEARRQLRDSDLPVGDIALQVGFSSAAHFSTAYRNHFGITPREERLVT